MWFQMNRIYAVYTVNQETFYFFILSRRYYFIHFSFVIFKVNKLTQIKKILSIFCSRYIFT